MPRGLRALVEVVDVDLPLGVLGLEPPAHLPANEADQEHGDDATGDPLLGGTHDLTVAHALEVSLLIVLHEYSFAISFHVPRGGRGVGEQSCPMYR